MKRDTANPNSILLIHFYSNLVWSIVRATVLKHFGVLDTPSKSLEILLN
jgi:hypothetical protein